MHNTCILTSSWMHQAIVLGKRSVSEVISFKGAKNHFHFLLSSFIPYKPSSEEIKLTQELAKAPALIRFLGTSKAHNWVCVIVPVFIESCDALLLSFVLAGLNRLKTAYLWRSVLIEFLAMMFLVAISSCSVLSSFGRLPAEDTPPLFDPVALPIAITNGILITFNIFAFAASSGGHVNPMISFATMLTVSAQTAQATFYLHAGNCCWD